MQITDIADAMLVGRLFEKIVNMQISFICTSNRKPGDLYKDGLNRELFLPFIDLLESNLRIFPLNADRDYRRDLLKGSEKYFVLSNPNSHDSFQKLWVNLTRGDKALPFEMHLLSLRNYEISFIRESYLSCNKKKLVYARTIIPRRTLNRKNEKLTKLGHKPLGEILFKNNNLDDLINVYNDFNSMQIENIKQRKINAKKESKKFTIFSHYNQILKVI